jgi:hypothetical protein
LDDVGLVYPPPPPPDLSLHFDYVDPAVVIGSDPAPFSPLSPTSVPIASSGSTSPVDDRCIYLDTPMVRSDTLSSWDSEFLDVDHPHTDLQILERGELCGYSGSFEDLGYQVLRENSMPFGL